MCADNQTAVTEVFLIGFQNVHELRVIIFSFAFLLYLFIFLGNFMIILLVLHNYRLHRPMYFFISNLSLAELSLTNCIIPKMLGIIWLEGDSMPIYGCITQYYFISITTYVQSYMLMVMSFDRYLAICFPLKYSSIMNVSFSIRLILVIWLLGICVMKLEITMIGLLQFCSSNVIDYFYCDFAPILALSSSDISVLVWLDMVLAWIVLFIPFIYIIVSYICIFIVILNMSARRKAFSTCISHLLVVFTYYGSLFAVYLIPSRAKSYDDNKLTSLLFVVLTPFTNPIIYSMKNKEIIETMKSFYNKMKLNH
ncbi:olfactory receptor 1500-like [Leptodactylus fuscus]|uniref:olfactory receptor 1500-like n=1 Tax=Leptodactylus fuscus TaxID=238119 RepID=UPI003F4E4F1E